MSGSNSSSINSFQSACLSHVRVRRRHQGIPSQCLCGENVVVYVSKTDDNPFRRFYRCEAALMNKREEHMFKWVDKALVEEMGMVHGNFKRLANEVRDFKYKIEEDMKKMKAMVVKLEEVLNVKKNKEDMKNVEIVNGNLKKIGCFVILIGVMTLVCKKLGGWGW